MAVDEATATNERGGPPPASARTETTNGADGPAKADPSPTSTSDAKDAKPEPSGEIFIAEGAKKRKKKPVEVAIRLTKVTKRFGAKTAVDGVTL